jgi:hypothetical protein
MRASLAFAAAVVCALALVAHAAELVRRFD